MEDQGAGVAIQGTQIFSRVINRIWQNDTMSWRGMRGRGRGGGSNRGGSHNTMSKRSRVEGPRTSQALCDQLLACDGAPYPVYKNFKGEWSFDDFSLILDHIQADPYANPSKVRVRIPLAVSGFPQELHSTKSRTIALADFIHRRLHHVCTARQFDQKAASSGWSGAKGGDIQVDLPCAQVLERSAVIIKPPYIEARICIGLPASGRSILGKWASEILTRNIETIVSQALRSIAYGDDLRAHINRRSRCAQGSTDTSWTCSIRPQRRDLAWGATPMSR